MDRMREELDNQFDVLYNSIASNGLPGIDTYEKSVFLTKSQDEVLLSYFDPRKNKVLEGFDSTEERQIDFSMVTKSKTYTNKSYNIQITAEGVTKEEAIPWEESPIRFSAKIEKEFGIKRIGHNTLHLTTLEGGTYEDSDDTGELIDYFSELCKESGYIFNYGVVETFKSPSFDLRDNTRSIIIDDDILMIINETAVVKRGNDNKKENLVVLPIDYNEYKRIMSKPFKRPLKYQAWRLIDSTDNIRRSELIVGPSDTIETYVMRYIKRPLPIILGDIEGLTINGYTYEEVSRLLPDKATELDPILIPTIVQRAIELAKATYAGDLTSATTIGSASSTDIGVVPQSNKQ